MDLTIVTKKVDPLDILESLNLRDSGDKVVMTFVKINGEKRAWTIGLPDAQQILGYKYNEPVEDIILKHEDDGWSYDDYVSIPGGVISLWMEPRGDDVAVDIEFITDLYPPFDDDLDMAVSEEDEEDGYILEDFVAYDAVFTRENWLAWMKALRKHFTL